MKIIVLFILAITVPILAASYFGPPECMNGGLINEVIGLIPPYVAGFCQGILMSVIFCHMWNYSNE